MTNKKHVQPRIVLLTFGLGGHMGYYEPREGYGTCTVSGYDSPDSFWKYNKHPVEEYEGAVVIDKCELLANSPKAVRLTLDAPMPDTRLKDEDVVRCPQPSPLFAEAILQGGGSFGTLMALHVVDKKWDGLSSVSIGTYTEYWRAAGARIGRVVNGAFEWEPSVNSRTDSK